MRFEGNRLILSWRKDSVINGGIISSLLGFSYWIIFVWFFLAFNYSRQIFSDTNIAVLGFLSFYFYPITFAIPS